MHLGKVGQITRDQIKTSAIKIAVQLFFKDISSYSESELYEMCCSGLENSQLRALVLREPYILLNAEDVGALVQEHQVQVQSILTADYIG